MVSVILVQLMTIIAIPLLIIAAYTTIQPSIKIFALQRTVTNNQTLKNTTHTVDNMTANINNSSQFRRSDNVGSKIEPSDISNGNTSTAALSNPQMVIKLLSSMSSDDISKFPLKDIPKDELLIVLNGLSVQDLFKTLENIPAADLADIFNKLPQDKSQAILNRLPSDQSQEILDRLTGQLTK
jgi:hypothetical protein